MFAFLGDDYPAINAINVMFFFHVCDPISVDAYQLYLDLYVIWRCASIENIQTIYIWNGENQNRKFKQTLIQIRTFNLSNDIYRYLFILFVCVYKFWLSIACVFDGYIAHHFYFAIGYGGFKVLHSFAQNFTAYYSVVCVVRVSIVCFKTVCHANNTLFLYLLSVFTCLYWLCWCFLPRLLHSLSFFLVVFWLIWMNKRLTIVCTSNFGRMTFIFHTLVTKPGKRMYPIGLK